MGTICFYRCGFLCQESYKNDQHRCHQGTANKIGTVEINRPCTNLCIIILCIRTPVLLQSSWNSPIPDTDYCTGIVHMYIFWWGMLPFRLMLSLASRKVFQTSKFQTSPRGKVADRKTGHITYRRQLQRTAGKRKMQNSQVSATLRKTKWKGCEVGSRRKHRTKKGASDFQCSGEKPELCFCVWFVHVPQLYKTAGQQCLLLAFLSLYCKLVQTIEWGESCRTFIFFPNLVISVLCLLIFWFALWIVLIMRQTLCQGKASAWLDLCFFQLSLRPV